MRPAKDLKSMVAQSRTKDGHAIEDEDYNNSSILDTT